MKKDNNKNFLIGGFVVTAVAAAYFFLVPQMVQQQQGVQQEAKVYEIHDDATFAANTQAYSDIPMNDNDLAFRIMIPKGWESDKTADSLTQELDYRILHNITRFKSPLIGITQATVTIQALRLEHEITAKNWLLNYIISNGYAPQGEIVSENKKTAAAYFVWTNDGVASYGYMRVYINGGKMIVARLDASVTHKDYLAYVQKAVPESFELTYPKESTVETQQGFTLVDAAKFNYPLSWSVLGTNFRDMNRLTVQLQNKGVTRKVEGFISVLAVRRTRSASFRNEIETLKEYFHKDFQLDILDMLSSDKIATSDRFIFNRYEVYNVQNIDKKRQMQELHLAALGDKDWYIFAFLITPKEQDNLYTWARNTETFNVLVQSMR